MIPVVCIVGRSGTGKTTLIEKLIPEFKGRGYRVAVLKHTDQHADWDKPGKDTWRFANAGSAIVVLSTPERVMVSSATDSPPSITGALRFVGGDCDLVLVEGFHQNPFPKIEVHRQSLGQGLLTDKHGLMAVVTDEKLDVAAPQFGLIDYQAVADLIVRKLLSSSEEIEVGLFLKGEPVTLSPFVADLVAKTLLGMVSSLKGTGEASHLDLWIRQKPK